VCVDGHNPVIWFVVFAVGDHEKVYGAVAPVGATVAVPSQAPKHVTFVDVPLETNAEGCVITDCCVRVQLLTSVTVSV
jgi:hypothetical protein